MFRQLNETIHEIEEHLQDENVIEKAMEKLRVSVSLPVRGRFYPGL